MLIPSSPPPPPDFESKTKYSYRKTGRSEEIKLVENGRRKLIDSGVTKSFSFKIEATNMM